MCYNEDRKPSGCNHPANAIINRIKSGLPRDKQYVYSKMGITATSFGQVGRLFSI